MLMVSAEKLGSVAVLHFEGRIMTGEAIKILRDAVMAQGEACAVVLDLTRVDLVDARGLGVLMELREWTQARGIELRLTNVNRVVQQVLSITGLDSVLKISAPADGSGRWLIGDPYTVGERSNAFAEPASKTE